MPPKPKTKGKGKDDKTVANPLHAAGVAASAPAPASAAAPTAASGTPPRPPAASTATTPPYTPDLAGRQGRAVHLGTPPPTTSGQDGTSSSDRVFTPPIRVRRPGQETPSSTRGGGRTPARSQQYFGARGGHRHTPSDATRAAITGGRGTRARERDEWRDNAGAGGGAGTPSADITRGRALARYLAAINQGVTARTPITPSRAKVAALRKLFEAKTTDHRRDTRTVKTHVVGYLRRSADSLETQGVAPEIVAKLRVLQTTIAAVNFQSNFDLSDLFRQVKTQLTSDVITKLFDHHRTHYPDQLTSDSQRDELKAHLTSLITKTDPTDLDKLTLLSTLADIATHNFNAGASTINEPDVPHIGSAYVDRYQACLSKLDAQVQASRETTFATHAATLRTLAEPPQRAGAVATTNPAAILSALTQLESALDDGVTRGSAAAAVAASSASTSRRNPLLAAISAAGVDASGIRPTAGATPGRGARTSGSAAPVHVTSPLVAAGAPGQTTTPADRPTGQPTPAPRTVGAGGGDGGGDGTIVSVRSPLAGIGATGSTQQGTGGEDSPLLRDQGGGGGQVTAPEDVAVDVDLPQTDPYLVFLRHFAAAIQASADTTCFDIAITALNTTMQQTKEHVTWQDIIDDNIAACLPDDIVIPQSRDSGAARATSPLASSTAQRRGMPRGALRGYGTGRRAVRFSDVRASSSDEVDEQQVSLIVWSSSLKTTQYNAVETSHPTLDWHARQQLRALWQQTVYNIDPRLIGTLAKLASSKRTDADFNATQHEPYDRALTQLTCLHAAREAGLIEDADFRRLTESIHTNLLTGTPKALTKCLNAANKEIVALLSSKVTLESYKTAGTGGAFGTTAQQNAMARCAECLVVLIKADWQYNVKNDYSWRSWLRWGTSSVYGEAENALKVAQQHHADAGSTRQHVKRTLFNLINSLSRIDRPKLRHLAVYYGAAASNAQRSISQAIKAAIRRADVDDKAKNVRLYMALYNFNPEDIGSASQATRFVAEHNDELQVNADLRKVPERIQTLLSETPTPAVAPPRHQPGRPETEPLMGRTRTETHKWDASVYWESIAQPVIATILAMEMVRQGLSTTLPSLETMQDGPAMQIGTTEPCDPDHPFIQNCLSHFNPISIIDIFGHSTSLALATLAFVLSIKSLLRNTLNITSVEKWLKKLPSLNSETWFHIAVSACQIAAVIAISETLVGQDYPGDSSMRHRTNTFNTLALTNLTITIAASLLSRYKRGAAHTTAPHFSNLAAVTTFTALSMMIPVHAPTPITPVLRQFTSFQSLNVEWQGLTTFFHNAWSSVKNIADLLPAFAAAYSALAAIGKTYSYQDAIDLLYCRSGRNIGQRLITCALAFGLSATIALPVALFSQLITADDAAGGEDVRDTSLNNSWPFAVNATGQEDINATIEMPQFSDVFPVAPLLRLGGTVTFIIGVWQLAKLFANKVHDWVFNSRMPRWQQFAAQTAVGFIPVTAAPFAIMQLIKQFNLTSPDVLELNDERSLAVITALTACTFILQSWLDRVKARLDTAQSQLHEAIIFAFLAVPTVALLGAAALAPDEYTITGELEASRRTDGTLPTDFNITSNTIATLNSDQLLQIEPVKVAATILLAGFAIIAILPWLLASGIVVPDAGTVSGEAGDDRRMESAAGQPAARQRIDNAGSVGGAAPRHVMLHFGEGEGPNTFRAGLQSLRHGQSPQGRQGRTLSQ